jgi:multidrug efflux pump subunit AcrA (membrane-fusion protein)
MNRKQLLLRVLPVMIILFAVSVFAYMKSSKPERKMPQASEKVWQVETLMAEKLSLSPGLTLYGEVETRSMLKAAAPGAGIVSEVMVKPGDRVVPGQALVSMDSRDFAVMNLQARADVEDFQAQLAEHELKHKSNLKSLSEEKKLLELATKEVQRINRLKAKNLSSESALSTARELLGKQELSMLNKQLEVDRYQTTRSQLQARLARAKAKLAEADLALERSELKARFEGIIAEVPVSVGDRVRVADILVSLYPIDSLEVRARIPSAYQAEVQQALYDGQQLQGEASLAAKMLKLELIRLAGEADASGINAYLRIVDGADRLRIGNLIKLNLQRPLQSNVIAVPFRAIYGNDRLFLLKEQRMVAIDVESLGQYETENGENALLIRSEKINDGDQIITTHLPNAVDGLKVKKVPGV